MSTGWWCFYGALIVTHHARWQNDFGALFIACSSQIFNDIFVNLHLFHIKVGVEIKYHTMVKLNLILKFEEKNLKPALTLKIIIVFFVDKK